MENFQPRTEGVYYTHDMGEKIVRFTFARGADSGLRRDRWRLLAFAMTWSGALAWVGLLPRMPRRGGRDDETPAE